MKKLFVATSFSGQVDYKTGKVKPEFREKIGQILIELSKIEDLTTFCAIEREGWIISNDPPEVGVKNDLAEIDQADTLLAILHDSPSAGVQYEMGYAAGRGKQVFAATEDSTTLTYFNQGLANNGNITHLNYQNPKLLAQEIKNRVL